MALRIPFVRKLEGMDSDRWECFTGWIILVYGLLLAVAALAYESPFRSSIENTFVAGFGTVLILIPTLVVVYTGRWLTDCDFEPEHQWRIMNWCGWGSLAIPSLTIGMGLYHRWLGYPIGDLGFTLLVSLATGAAIGILVGVRTESTRRYAKEVDTQKETLLFLNRLLRHNVLNGMNVIQGYTERLDSRFDASIADDLAPIRSQSDRIVELINHVRALGGALAGELETQPVDLSALLERELETARTSFPEAEFTADIPSDVWVCANEVVAIAFENVLRNAVEHNDAETPIVSVTVEAVEETAIVRVADNGPGIPEECKETLFERGEHGDDGFGLFLVHRLVTQYGGHVRTADDGTRGTVVTITVPLVETRGSDEKRNGTVARGGTAKAGPNTSH